MNSPDIQIPRKITNQLLHLAQISPDYEVCGLIGSKNGLPTHCYPIKNSAGQPRQRFLLDAAQQISTMAKMRELGEELFAIYHSHPAGPDRPSPTDVAEAAYPNVIHLIWHLQSGAWECSGFLIDDQQVLPVTIQVMPFPTQR